jgi:phage repressor protein C with HTH and peptisase S24 domain
MRAKDPKYLAMKQLAKDRRREAGKAFRAKLKAEQGVERKAEKKESSARRAGERAARDQELRGLLTRGAAPAKEPIAPTGDALASPGAIEGSEEHAPLLRVRSPRSDYDVN